MKNQGFVGLAFMLVALMIWYQTREYTKEAQSLLSKEDVDMYLRFTNLTFPFNEWTHISHVRLGYIVCCMEVEHLTPGFSLQELYGRVYTHLSRLINRFNDKHKEKLNVGFHESITHLWAHLILDGFLRHIDQKGDTSFDAFILHNPDLKTFATSFQYYSREILFSPAAKVALVKPPLRSYPIDFTSDTVQ